MLPGPLPLDHTGGAKPKSTVRAISEQLYTLRWRISLERIKQSTSGKRRYELQSLPRSTTNDELQSTDNKVQAPNVYSPKNEHVLCRLMRLHSPGGVATSEISTP